MRPRQTLAKETAGTTPETGGSSLLGFTETSADTAGNGSLRPRGTSAGAVEGIARTSMGTSIQGAADRRLPSDDDALLPGLQGATSGPFAGLVGASTRTPPPDVVRRVVHTRWNNYQACYQAAAMTNPTLRGAVNVRFVIAKDGTVTDASDAGGSIADRAVTTCVVNAFPGLRFPPPGGADDVAVTYSLHFSSGE